MEPVPAPRSHRALHIAIGAIVALVLVTAVTLAVTAYLRGGTVEATATDFPNEAWVFTCRINHKAPERADESFSGPVLEGYERNRGPHFVERVYPGTRVWVNVSISRATGGLSPGRHRVYGTVESIDVYDRRAVLKDCLFIER